MFSCRNLQNLGLFSIYSNRRHTDIKQREFDRKFRQQVRAERRCQWALGPRLERWKWQRFLDGDFSGFEKVFEEVILIPIASVMVGIVVLGMFIVQLDFVDEFRYRHFMTMTLIIVGLGVILLRYLVFYGLRIWVASYGEARIEDAWILNSNGRVEEVSVFDESEFED